MWTLAAPGVAALLNVKRTSSLTAEAPQTHWPEPAAAPQVQLREEMSVAWQGVEYPVAAWDVHGFQLADPIPRVLTPGRGRVADFTLLIGPRGTRIEMQVQARASEGEGAPVAFRFVDLQRAQSEVLHRIVDHAVNRKSISLTRLLHETEETRVVRHATEARVIAFRKWFQMSLAVAALAGAAAFAWTSQTRVQARYAAVTVPATGVSIPVAGVVAAVMVQPGQAVQAGDVLARIRPNDLDRRIEVLADQRRALESEQEELRTRAEALTQLGALSDQGMDGERARLGAAVALAERRVAVERATLEQLRANGLPTAERQAARARQDAVVLEAEQQVLAARSRYEALLQAEALAPLGVVPGLGRDPSGGLGVLELRLAQTSAEIQRAHEREADLLQGDPVLSPCDCVVTQIDRRAGEWADPSRPLAVLAETAAPTIHALVLADHARALRNGDVARVELADGTRLSGRVVRMNYSAFWPGYTGLQDNVFAADRFARIEIALERPITHPAGMTATVNISTDRLLGPLLQRIGL